MARAANFAGAENRSAAGANFASVQNRSGIAETIFARAKNRSAAVETNFARAEKKGLRPEATRSANLAGPAVNGNRVRAQSGHPAQVPQDAKVYAQV